MRIAVFGAGAVGGQIAARLASSGMPVSLVARGAHLRAIREDGLALLTDDQMIRVAVEASDNPADFGAQDCLIVAVKGTQLPHAVAALHPLIGDRTRVLFAMNGLPWWFTEGLPVPATADLQRCLDPLGNLKTIAAPEQIIWGVVTAGATIAGPGTIKSTTPGANSITIGYPDDRTDEPLCLIKNLLARASYRATIARNIREAIWSKLLTNAAQAMVATATNRSHIEVTSDPETRNVIIHVMQELIAIGASIGLNVECDPFEMTSPSRFGRHIPSFLQDLRAGRPLELSNTILAARETARALSLSSPYLTTLAAIVAAQSADTARSKSEEQATGLRGAARSERG
jgi:2-dehydropantoate 2-reductase